MQPWHFPQTGRSWQTALASALGRWKTVRGGIALALCVAALLAGAVGGARLFGGSHTAHANAGPGAPDTVGVFTQGGCAPTCPPAFFLRYSNSSGNANRVVTLGASGMIPIAGDWDGHGVSTVGVYDPNAGQFWLQDLNETGQPIAHAFPFGPPHSIPIVGDWTGAGHDSIGVFYPPNATFYLRYTLSGGAADAAYTLGTSSMLPVAGDWVGTGHTSIGVYDPNSGVFYLDKTPASGNADFAILYGPPHATPISGDWTNSGMTGLGIQYNGVFYLKNDATTAGNADTAFAYGPANATPVVGHWVSPSALAFLCYPMPPNSQSYYPLISRIGWGSDSRIWATAHTGPQPSQYYGEVLQFAPGQSASVNTYLLTSQGFKSPTRIVSGPDGALWFGDNGSGHIGRIVGNGTVTSFTPPHGTDYEGIASGPDGALWFTETDANRIGRITTGGTITEYPIPTASSRPTAIVAGPDGALWFTEMGAAKIGRITSGGTITEYSAALTAGDASPDNIVAGPDGNLWYTLFNISRGQPTEVAKMNTAGMVLNVYAASATTASDLQVGPDGNLWLANGGLYRVTTSGTVTSYSRFTSAQTLLTVPQSGGIAAGLWANQGQQLCQYDLG